jgi:competence protein ComEC
LQLCVQAQAMSILLLVLVPLLAGCVPGNVRSDGVPSADAPFTLTALDVGQGDAVLLRTPTVTVLVDAGDPDADVVGALRRNGVRQLDLLVVTHAHLDHVGGAPAVLAAMPVGEVWMHPPPAGVVVVDQVAATLQGAAGRGVSVRGPPAGARVVLGDLRLEVLGPPSGRPFLGTRSEVNNSSIVLRASVVGAGSVLLAGDAEAEAQQDLMARFGVGLRTDVLVVPHHGSRTSDPAFLAAVGAHTAVLSVGRSNRHGHPHPQLMATLERLGMEVLRTDVLGDVHVAVTARVPALT